MTQPALRDPLLRERRCLVPARQLGARPLQRTAAGKSGKARPRVLLAPEPGRYWLVNVPAAVGP
jgi:hypothetical protein